MASHDPVDRLTGLDTLRSIAIVHVVLTHGAMTFMPDLPGWGGRLIWLLIATNFGVPLFFVLSGFLITRQLAGGMSVGPFYRHRLAKIYPMFLMAVIVFGLLGGVTDATVWLLHGFALHNIDGSISSRVHGHLWSLAVEIQFYALAPLLFLLGYRRLSLGSMAVLAAVVCATHAGYLLSVPDRQDARLAGLLNVYQFTSFNIVALLLGALVYRAYAAGQTWRGAFFVGSLATVGMPLICLVVVPTLLVGQVDLENNWHLLASLALIALPPVASACLAHLTLRGNWFSDPRWRPVARFIATISYQWYLWHPLVLLGMLRLGTARSEVGVWMQTWPWLTLGAYVLVSAVLGWASYRWLEHPIHRWILGRSEGASSQKQSKSG